MLNFNLNLLRMAIRRLSSQKILVIHIAKTAGTSLRIMLEYEYGARFIYPGRYYLKDLPNGLYPTGSEMLDNYSNLPFHRVLVGHFTAAMADLLPRPYQTATFLREPIQRSLSMLTHFSSTLNVSVSSLIENPQFMSANIADYQTRVLGADRVCEPGQVEIVDEKVLNRAISRLEALNFVGLTERFDESCQIFDQRFRTRISRFVRRENVRRPNGNELAEHIPYIKQFLERDRILYDAAVARFNTLSK